jgi:hypothetical protein
LRRWANRLAGIGLWRHWQRVLGWRLSATSGAGAESGSDDHSPRTDQATGQWWVVGGTGRGGRHSGWPPARRTLGSRESIDPRGRRTVAVISESGAPSARGGWSDDRAQDSSSRGPPTVSVVAPAIRALRTGHRAQPRVVPRPVPARRTARPPTPTRAPHPARSSPACRASPRLRPSHGPCRDADARRRSWRACRAQRRTRPRAPC